MSDVFVTLISRRNGQELLFAMLKSQIRFLIIGGCAMEFWNLRKPDDVKDMDLLIEPRQAKASSLKAILEGFGQKQLDEARFSKPAMLTHLDADRTWQFDADILTPFSSEFDMTKALAQAAIYPFLGFELKVASIATMIELKEATIESASKPNADARAKAQLSKHQVDLIALLGAAQR
jgi:hypothetical protein